MPYLDTGWTPSSVVERKENNKRAKSEEAVPPRAAEESPPVEVTAVYPVQCCENACRGERSSSPAVGSSRVEGKSIVNSSYLLQQIAVDLSRLNPQGNANSSHTECVWDGIVAKGACHQACSQSPVQSLGPHIHGGEEEPTPASCPSMCKNPTLWRVHLTPVRTAIIGNQTTKAFERL